MSLQNPPPELKVITPFLQRAKELNIRYPLVSYYCLYYAANLAMKEDISKAECNKFLKELFDVLEKRKMELSQEENVNSEESIIKARLQITTIALNAFKKSDNEDRSGNATKNTAKTFHVSSNLFEVLSCFGDLDEDIKKKIKYAKWKAADISKAIREGRTPVPGSPVKQPQELKINSPLSPLSGGNSQSNLQDNVNKMNSNFENMNINNGNNFDDGGDPTEYNNRQYPSNGNMNHNINNSNNNFYQNNNTSQNSFGSMANNNSDHMNEFNNLQNKNNRSNNNNNNNIRNQPPPLPPPPQSMNPQFPPNIINSMSNSSGGGSPLISPNSMNNMGGGIPPNQMNNMGGGIPPNQMNNMGIGIPPNQMNNMGGGIPPNQMNNMGGGVPPMIPPNLPPRNNNGGDFPSIYNYDSPQPNNYENPMSSNIYYNNPNSNNSNNNINNNSNNNINNSYGNYNMDMKMNYPNNNNNNIPGNVNHDINNNMNNQISNDSLGSNNNNNNHYNDIQSLPTVPKNKLKEDQFDSINSLKDDDEDFNEPDYPFDPAIILKAQKHSRFAISALQYDDVAAAIKNLKTALELLKPYENIPSTY